MYLKNATMVETKLANKEKKTEKSVNNLHVITNTFPRLELWPFLNQQEIVTLWKKVILLKLPGSICAKAAKSRV